MPDQTLDQLPDSLSAEETDNLYATRSGNSIRMKLGVAIASRVPTSRQITTINGIKGGGTLAADRPLELDVVSLSEDTAPDLANDFLLSHDASTNLPRKVRMDRIGSGVGGSTATPDFSTIAVVGQTSVTTTTAGETLNFGQGANISITTDPTTKLIRWAATGVVTNTTTVSAGAGLSGGGSLAISRSLSVDIAGQSEDTAPDLNTDYIMTHDVSAGVLRKVRLALLSSSSYTLPIANASRLGGIRIGSGFSYDEATGILSVAPTGTSYVLPAATSTVRGGIRIGSGFTISGDLLANANPTPYVLPAAGVNTLGGVKQGPGVTIASDGTISAEVSSGGSSDAALRPETRGAIRGTGLTQQQRESNTALINATLAEAATVKGKVDMGGGTWEIHGPLTLSSASNMVIAGDWCTIRQFQSGVSVLSMTTVSQVTVSGFMLAYQTSQITGADPTVGETYVAALRINSANNCRFSDIDTRNAWVHVGMSGGTGSNSNTLMNVRCNMATGQSWGLVYKTGSGNNFVNVRVSNPGDTTKPTVTGGAYISDVDQATFTNLVLENLNATRTLSFVDVRAATVTGGVLIGNKPRAASAYAGLIHGSTNSMVQMTGIHVGTTVLDAATQSMTNVSVFMGENGCAFLVANLTVTGTTKDGSPIFSLLGHTSAAAAKNVSGTFQQVRLDTDPAFPHRLDDLCVATIDPTSDNLTGPLLSYNNVLGEVTGSLFSVGNESMTVYPAAHGRHITVDVPLTAERTITISRFIDRAYASSLYSAPRTVRGATLRVTRGPAATGTALLTVANHNGTSIVTLAANQSVMVVFDGSNFVQVPGSLSTGGGGGGGDSVVFATTSEATTGTSTTTVMSPVRTKEAFDAFSAANEITGTSGQVLGFDAAGNATTVKLTRTMMVPLIADSVGVTAGSTVRRIQMPISMKLSTIRAFLPTPGTTATTIDVNAAGSSVLTTPLTVAGSTATASSASFSSASGGTITQGTVVDFDIDVAGTGAKGLQVTLIGAEV